MPDEVIFESDACIITRHAEGFTTMRWKRTNTAVIGIEDDDIAEAAARIVDSLPSVQTRIHEPKHPGDRAFLGLPPREEQS